MFVPQILHTIFLNIMKTKLFFLAFLTSLLSWGQATLPVSRTSNWNTPQRLQGGHTQEQLIERLLLLVRVVMLKLLIPQVIA